MLPRRRQATTTVHEVVRVCLVSSRAGRCSVSKIQRVAERNDDLLGVQTRFDQQFLERVDRRPVDVGTAQLAESVDACREPEGTEERGERGRTAVHA